MKDKCGIIGIHSKNPSKDVSTSIYYGLYALQHRGQESSGITTCGQFGVNHHYGMGLATDVFDKPKLEQMKGNVGIGHVRYSTVGGSQFENSEPFVTDLCDGFIAIAHNGDIVNSGALRQELTKKGYLFRSTTDSEVIAYLIKEECRNGVETLDALDIVASKLQGAYSLVILINHNLYVMRDPMAMKPLALGQTDDSYILASETVAFDVVGANFVRDLEPGEIVRVKDGQIKSKLYTNDVTDKICAMEYIYFSRPDSNLDGINVHTTRKLAGKQLFKEAPVEADLVIGVPDSSISAAIGYAEAANIPYEMGLIKNKYVGRTFIQPTQEMREQGVRMKLSAVSSIVKGKRVVMIDDSIVRGTTSKRIVRLLKEAGAREVHVRIASPAIKYPCFYGVDMSTMDELISNRLNVNELCNYIEADSLAFITEEGIDKSIHFNKEKHKCSLCLACFNGEYVTNLYDSFEMDKIKKGKEY